MRRIVSKIDGRIETGALQINDDWPGVFIRGDDCYLLKMWLEEVGLENLLAPEIDRIIEACKEATHC